LWIAVATVSRSIAGRTSRCIDGMRMSLKTRLRPRLQGHAGRLIPGGV
jgi:hypothetical protein